MGATIDDEVRDYPASYVWLPYSHAAACAVLERLALVAVSDVAEDRVRGAQDRYGVAHGYSDYRVMIEEERPDLLCIATRPATHAEITRFATEHGVAAIYCEKPLCCSPQEADGMVEACRKHHVHFNYGTQRRYTPIFRRARALIDAGEIGRLEVVIAHCGPSAAMWGHTHTADMLMYLAGDPEVEFAQATVAAGEEDWQGDRLLADPGILMGYARFWNGVHGYLTAALGDEYEVRGSAGAVRVLNNGESTEFRRARERWRRLEAEPLPEASRESGTVNGLRELIQALDGTKETTGGIDRARASQEIIFAWIESERRGGARVPLPLDNRGLTVQPLDW
jgi:predicted dehydrogenase